MSKDCLFCRIVAGELPARHVFADRLVLAFHDVNPQAPFHALIVPRRHVADLSSLAADDHELLAHLQGAVVRLAAMQPSDRPDYRLVVNCGAGAGQSVFHLHYHFLAGRPFGWPPG